MASDTNRVKEIFLGAAELPDAAAQAAYLDRACGGDAGLRDRVEALLRAHDPAGSFLGTPAAAPSSFEGVVYTRLPWWFHLVGLPEMLVSTPSAPCRSGNAFIKPMV